MVEVRLPDGIDFDPERIISKFNFLQSVHPLDR